MVPVVVIVKAGMFVLAVVFFCCRLYCCREWQRVGCVLCLWLSVVMVVPARSVRTDAIGRYIVVSGVQKP